MNKMETADYIKFLEGEIQALTKLIDNEEFPPAQEVKIRCERNRIVDTLYNVSENDTIHMDDWKMCADKMPENLQTVIGVYVNHDPAPYHADNENEQLTAPLVYYAGKWYWWNANDVISEYRPMPDDLIAPGIEVICWKPMPELPIML